MMLDLTISLGLHSLARVSGFSDRSETIKGLETTMQACEVRVEVAPVMPRLISLHNW